MRAFEYAAPNAPEQAVRLLSNSWGDSEMLAGGSDLLVLMKDDVVHPRRLVNIKAVRGCNGVRVLNHGLSIGALTTLGDLADNVHVIRHYPAVAEALKAAASPQIRNVATIGGNICQRPRCWYFRSGLGLLALDPAGRSRVVTGDNRYHAILGNDGPAKFVSPSTVVPVLIAYGATVRVLGPTKLRELRLEDFFRTPQSENEREHDLLPNEMITELLLPASDNLFASHYEVRQKAAFDWPLATAAVALTLEEGKVQSARVVLGQVAPVPWRSREAEYMLVGKRITAAVASHACEAALRKATPLSRNAYKVQLARVAVKRAILKAAGVPA